MTPSASAATRWLRALLATVLLVLGAQLPGSLAHADETTTEPVQLTITSITPSSSAGSGRVTIQGTARNTGTEDLTGAQIYLWRSADPVRDAPTLDEVLSSAPENPVGARLYEHEDNYFNITTYGTEDSEATPGKRVFAPGEQVRFQVSGEVSGAGGFGFTTRPAAYLVGLQVKVQGRQGVFGRARALLPVAAPASVSATTVVQLQSRPGRLQGTVFGDDHLATELTGRLRTLLDLALRPGNTAVIDPALYDDVAAMAQGYTVQGSTASTAAGQAAAKSFLAELDTLVARGHSYRTPYGNPNVALAEAAGRPDLLDHARKALPATHPLARLPLAVVPLDGIADADLVRFVAPLEPDVVLVQGQDSSPAVSTLDGITIVNFPAGLFAGGPGPLPSATDAQRTGRLQAQQLTTPTVALVSTEAQARLAGAPAPWRVPMPLDQLVAATKNPPVATFSDDATADPGNWLYWADRSGDDLRAWGELTEQPEAATTAVDQMLSRATSTAWGTSRFAATKWARAVASQYGDVLGGDEVTLTVTPEIVLSAPEQEVPVTVTNHLDHEVSVRVHFASDAPQRLQVADSELETIPAGGTESVRVTVSSRANGTVGVKAQLATSSGRAVGPVREVTVTSTQMGRVGWLIILGSGIVLLGATAWRIRQVQAEKRRSQPVADLGASRR